MDLLLWAAPPERCDRFFARDADMWGLVLAQRLGIIREQALADRLGLSRVPLSAHREMVEHGQAFLGDLRDQLAAHVRALYARCGPEDDTIRCLGTRLA